MSNTYNVKLISFCTIYNASPYIVHSAKMNFCTSENLKDSVRDLKCVSHVSMLYNFNSEKGEIKFLKSTKEKNGFKRAQIAEGLLDMLSL